MAADPSDSWAARWRRLNSKPEAVRARYWRFCNWVISKQPLPF